MELGGFSEKVDLAYKFPFCSYTRELLDGVDISSNYQKYLDFGKERVQKDVSMKNRYYEIGIGDIKFEELKGYAYARMIVSSLRNPYMIERFCRGEAQRSKEALVRGDSKEIMFSANQVGVGAVLGADGLFVVHLSDFLKNMPKRDEFRLVNNKIYGGKLFLMRGRMIELIEEGIYRKVKIGLPIPTNELPKQIVEMSKKMDFDMHVNIGVPKRKGRNTAWIESVLETPIPDVRHRTINLILAPYLTNVKGMDVEQAAKVIVGYIEECKKLNPDTRVNDAYIRYQCRYAKEHKLRPLSLTNAKSLLGNFVRFD